MNKLKFGLIAGAVISGVCSSGSVLADLTTGVMITNVGSDLRQPGGLVSLELSKDIKNGVCQRNNVLFLDPSDSTHRALIAVAITAKVNETPVTLIDDGVCGELLNGSTVSKVALMKG